MNTQPSCQHLPHAATGHRRHRQPGGDLLTWTCRECGQPCVQIMHPDWDGIIYFQNGMNVQL